MTDSSHFHSLEQLSSEKFKRIFFYRICGTGMGAAACLLNELDYEVAGGDWNFYPPMSTYLQSSGIKCFKLADLKEDDLKKYDLIVVGNVVSKSSDDAMMLENLGVPLCSFPAVLGAFFLRDKIVVGLAGTHGKTTTTYYATQLFENLGKQPGYFIGGVMDDRPPAAAGAGKYFFIESDEYDSAYFEKFSKFTSYQLSHMVLTSLEFDHADIYESIADIQKEFKKVMPKLPGKLIYNKQYAAIEEMSSDFPKVVVTYGDYDQQISFDQSTGETSFNVKYKDATHSFKTNVWGQHNIENLSSCILFALSEGFSPQQVQQSILELKQVKRRQELKGKFRGNLVIDDFAHHPTAIRLTLNAIKNFFRDQSISVIYDPCSATSRSDIFQEDTTKALSLADKVVIIKPSRKTTAKGHGDIDVDRVCDEINGLGGKTCKVISTLPQLTDEMAAIAADKSIIAVLSNGTCLGLWESEFVDELV